MKEYYLLTVVCYPIRPSETKGFSEKSEKWEFENIIQKYGFWELL